MEVKADGFDATSTRGAGAGTEVVVDVEHEHEIEHRIHQLKHLAARELSGDMSVTEVEAHAGVLAVQATDEVGDRARVVAHMLGPWTGARFSIAILTPSAAARRSARRNDRSSSPSRSRTRAPAIGIRAP
jgi:hypothetical protein